MEKFRVIVCAILKDETPYLEEWIEHYLNIGIEHFVLYDNNSAIPIKETLSKYIKAGEVEVVDCGIENAPHLKAYNHCLYTLHDQAKWMAFIDGDEFITLKRHKHIYDLLVEYEEFPGLCLNWVIFGANGHIYRPVGGVKQAYTTKISYNAPINRHVKTIVQTKHVHAMVNPHFAFYDVDCFAVNECRQKVEGAFSDFSNYIAQINHYYTKSFEEWMIKIGKGFSSSALIQRKVDLFWEINSDMVRLRDEIEGKFKDDIKRYYSKWGTTFIPATYRE